MNIISSSNEICYYQICEYYYKNLGNYLYSSYLYSFDLKVYY